MPAHNGYDVKPDYLYPHSVRDSRVTPHGCMSRSTTHKISRCVLAAYFIIEGHFPINSAVRNDRRIVTYA